MENNKIRSFTDLVTWKEAHNLALAIYTATKSFPLEEKYSLVDQMRRSALSISSNIAEGFSRQSQKEKTQFYFVAKGSTTELQNQLLLARDVGYTPSEDFNKIADQTIYVHKLINGLIRTSTKY